MERLVGPYAKLMHAAHALEFAARTVRSPFLDRMRYIDVMPRFETAQSPLRERVLIVVRTYPVPSRKSVEVSCTAGVTRTGNWIRLFPIPYRFMQLDKRFRKYQEIDVEIVKAPHDKRPESFRINDLDSIDIVVSDPLPTKNHWEARWNRVGHLLRCCMCCIEEERRANGSPTLGFFKPAELGGIEIEETNDQWADDELAKLRQFTLWGEAPHQELEKIPFRFKYRYRCPHERCNGHSQSCTDWEMGQSYRKWKNEYGDDWERAFHQKYEEEMIHKNDTHFFVGNMHQHPASWLVVGLWYPRKGPRQPSMLL